MRGHVSAKHNYNYIINNDLHRVFEARSAVPAVLGMTGRNSPREP